ncbi:hypothetical protein MLD38_008548 [Melastoma candidum]|uniref:Uncharacterized protein n=1 Tax=Melastoma candidum TaxID=119954 RepID=A0ACB9RU53_9MYRT|nr:hypothetical protein MLD38_008548 [Melastoma candidum]
MADVVDEEGFDKKEMMLLRMLEWLRPLVHGRFWDYAVVWKLSDDPAGVIAWVGCCCSGSRKFADAVVAGREEKDGVGGGGGSSRIEGKGCRWLCSGQYCRDGSVKHRVRSAPCEGLASVPSSLPLYSGIHGEVVLLNQAAWISSRRETSEEDNPTDESKGTRILIPVYGGVIELFTEKNLPEDKKLIELVIIQSRIFSNLISDDGSMKFSPNIQQQSTDCLGSSQSEPFVPRKSQKISSARAPSHCCATVDYNLEDITRSGAAKHQKGEDHCFRSKNLMTERKRRQRIKDGLFTLRSLVPNISKMDTGAIIGDAIVYIKKLQQEANELEEEARSTGDVDNKSVVAGKWNAGSSMEDTLDRSSCIEPKADIEVRVEMHTVGEGRVLARVVCGKTRGWFTRVMEKLGALGLTVEDVNVTTFDGKALAVLMLQGCEKDGGPAAETSACEWRETLEKAVGADVIN